MEQHYQIICLGVGNGSSHVIKGLPSTAFVILKDDKPFILVDCGLGVVKSFLDLYSAELIPEYIYLSHNHTDHTGDLPVLLALYSKFRNGKPKIFGHQDVLEIVKMHRIHELCVKGENYDDYATWINNDDNNEIFVEKGVRFEIFLSQHSYLCYGFRFFVDNVNILSYTADSGFNTGVYVALGSPAVIVVDGRDKGSFEHASLEEIDKYGIWAKTNKILVVHYEFTDYRFASSNVRCWQIGDKVELS